VLIKKNKRTGKKRKEKRKNKQSVKKGLAKQQQSMNPIKDIESSILKLKRRNKKSVA